MDRGNPALCRILDSVQLTLFVDCTIKFDFVSCFVFFSTPHHPPLPPLFLSESESHFNFNLIFS